MPQEMIRSMVIRLQSNIHQQKSRTDGGLSRIGRGTIESLPVLRTVCWMVIDLRVATCACPQPHSPKRYIGRVVGRRCSLTSSEVRPPAVRPHGRLSKRAGRFDHAVRAGVRADHRLTEDNDMPRLVSG